MRPPTPRECSTGHAGAENTNTPPDDTIIYAADTRHKRDCSTSDKHSAEHAHGYITDKDKYLNRCGGSKGKLVVSTG